MERRVFIAIVLSFLVLYMYQAYFAPPPPAPAKPAASTASQTQASTAASGTDASPATSQAPAAAAPQPAAAPEPQALVSEASEREITVDTSTVQAVFTNRGGRLLHWRLKSYRDNRGAPVDLVPGGLPATEQQPFSLRVDQPDLTARLNNAI
jgi:YidC/Oxa1 family membrane protein insertase